MHLTARSFSITHLAFHSLKRLIDPCDFPNENKLSFFETTGSIDLFGLAATLHILCAM